MMLGAVRLAPVAGLLLFVPFPGFSATQPADVSFYLVEKGIELNQTNSDQPFPQLINGYVSEALVECSNSNTVTNATVKPPTGVVQTLTAQPGNQEFRYRKKDDSLGQLNAVFPSGTYTLSISTIHDGLETLFLSFQGDLYPRTPHLLAFNSTQNIDAGGYLNFTWDYEPDGVFPDFVQLHVDDTAGNKVFESPDNGPGALDGAANSFLLVRGTLAPNQVYNATLLCRKTVATDTDSYPGAIGTALYYRRVHFEIQTAPTANSADVKLYMLTKTQLFQQISTNTPQYLPTNGFRFDALVKASTSNSVLSAALLLAQATTTNFTLSSDRTQLEINPKLDTQSDLDLNYPNGEYTLSITGVTQGVKTVALQLATNAYPSTPKFLNPTAAQAIDPSRDFVFQWEPFVGGTSSDYIQLQLEDPAGNNLFETPDIGKSQTLTGLRFSAKVPDRTLNFGTTYTAKLLIMRIVGLDTTSYPGTLGIAGFARETRLQIMTIPGPSPRLANLRYQSPQSFSFSILGTSNQVYRIETSADLKNWFSVGNTTLTNGAAQFTDPAAVLSQQFYRAVQP